MHPALARVASLLGLASLGEGLFILLRVVPHEAWWLGAILLVVGAALLALSPPPRVERLPRAALLVGGIALSALVLAYDALRHAPLDAPKIGIVLLGAGLSIVAPFADRPRVATPSAWALALAGAPLAVWGVQALSKSSIAGATPLELFLRYGLIAPMAAVLAILGRDPRVSGQVVTYQTPHGPFSLEVGVACSGLQAMALFGAILLVYVALEKPGWRRGLAWSAIGLTGVYVINVVRLVALALVGSAWGPAALEWFHANLGWMFFVAWSGAFAWLAMGRRGPAQGAKQARSPQP